MGMRVRRAGHRPTGLEDLHPSTPLLQFGELRLPEFDRAHHAGVGHHTQVRS